MTNNEWCDVLCHHGILGQKWGSRNGPPYPLKSSVSKQIKKGNNPKFKKDEAYRKEREKAKKGESGAETEGFSLGKKKKKGLFNKLDKKQRVNDLPQEYQNVQKVQEILDEDRKYLDSRNYGSKDLRNLTTRFNDEANYNDALSRRYESENKMMQNYSRRMSRKERKKYEKMMRKMENDAAYNEAIQRQIDSQINLIRSQNTLKQLTAKPEKKSLLRRGKEWTQQWAKTSVQNGLYNVGSRATTILFNEMFDQAMYSFYNKNDRHKNPKPGDIKNQFLTSGGGGGGKKNNKNNNS